MAISTNGERIRDDARVPVLVLQSETDVILLGGQLAEQPDSDRLRTWEMAGAAHADTYTVSVGRHDDGTLTAVRMAELLRPTSNLMIGQTDTPINAGPQQHYVAEAALVHLSRWAAGGDAPPSAPSLELNADRTGYVLDEHGIARGGIRTPWVDVPNAVMGGLGQSGETFAMLFGRTEPFDDATLAKLVPGERTSTSNGSARRSTQPSPPASSWRRTALRSWPLRRTPSPYGWPTPADSSDRGIHPALSPLVASAPPADPTELASDLRRPGPN